MYGTDSFPFCRERDTNRSSRDQKHKGVSLTHSSHYYINIIITALSTPIIKIHSRKPPKPCWSSTWHPPCPVAMAHATHTTLGGNIFSRPPPPALPSHHIFSRLADHAK